MILRTALIQMPVTADKTANLQTALSAVADAAQHGAELAVLPEMFCCPYDNACFRDYGEPEDGPMQQALSRAAADAGLYLVGGSMPELADGRVYNTSFVYGPQGQRLAKHRKVHLFDIDVAGGQRFRESDTLSPGDQVTVFDTPFGRIGLCICFDFRFQELAQSMTRQGARIIAVPAAFNMTTGPAHWELLFRQRAVDNQIFTIGVSPARDPQASYVAYGHSMAADPWGTVLCQAEDQPAVLYTDLDLDRVGAVRRQLPILAARRPELY